MNLRLPKSNVEWDVRTEGSARFADVTVSASFRLPSGEVCAISARAPERMLEGTGYQRHFIDAMLDDLSREVGRRMVRG